MARSVVLIVAVAAVAEGQGIPIPPPDQDPFVGQWRANASKSYPKLDKAEASYQRTITREGDDLIFDSSDGGPKGQVRHFSIRCDGVFHVLPSGSLQLCRYVSTHRVEGDTRDPNQKHNYWAREVSADGQTMTVIEYRDQSRTKVRSVRAFDRAP